MMTMKDRENLDASYVGSYFDRQVRIDDWDQKMLEKQVVFILGVGGLGSVVAMNLLRLGIKKLILLDYDVVDKHNLNRQIMYSVKDIGKNKVEAAKENATFHNINNTEIVAFHGNALTNWTHVIKFVEEANMVYNCIDHGDSFDTALSSLCLKLEKPFIMGGTFAVTMTVDFFGPKGRACYLCSDLGCPQETLQKITPDKIMNYQDLSFLPKNNNPVGRSSAVVCLVCGQFMVSHFLNYLFLSEEKPYKANRLICYHNTFQIMKFEIERERKCLFCGDNEKEAKQYELQCKKKKEQEQRQKSLENTTEKINLFLMIAFGVYCLLRE